MKLRTRLDVKLILVILVVTFENVSSDSNIYTRAKYSKKDSNDNLDTARNPLFITPLLEAGKADVARNLAKVIHRRFLNIESYAGYFTVNKTFNSNLFFWYFPAKENPANAPVVLFLEGGPGMTSLFSLFGQNGPFAVTARERLRRRKASWNNKHNMIYIDSPVGTGYSFTDSSEAYATTEEQIGAELRIAMQQFFQLFPSLRKNDFFVTGESYAGKFVPAVSYSIHLYNAKVKEDKKINLKGMVIANGFTDPVSQLVYGEHLYDLGLIDANGRDQFLAYEKKIRDLILQDRRKAANDVLGELIMFTENSLFNNLTGYRTPYNILKPENMKSYDHPCPWIESVDARQALHVGNTPFTPFASKVLEGLIEDMTKSQADLVAALLDHYPILIYTGILDMLCSYSAMRNYLQNLVWSGAEEFRTAERQQWHVAGGTLAGYIKKAGNLVEVLVLNAGHFSSMDQPQRTLELVEKFIQGSL